MKKKIVYINVVCNGSTGKIMCETAMEAEKNGFETYCFYGRGQAKPGINAFKIGNKLSILFHVLLARLGFNGRGSYFATKKLVKKLKEINPDIIHMHNIHGYYLNLKILFNYLKKEYQGKLIWNIHDCWAFTGHCSHFTYAECYKWKSICYNCPQLRNYPKKIFDNSRKEYLLKKELFTNIKNLELIVPTNWLKNLIKESFLKEYKTHVIGNGIALNIFKNNPDEDIYKKYSIPKNKRIILGVSNVWAEKKGLDIFIEMSKIISQDEIIVLVGVNKKQNNLLPNNIVGIMRTDNQEELAKIYSISDVFINPSYEETFSLVTAEALACGLPVVVCGMTAVKELINNQVGIVVYEYTASKYYEAYKKIKVRNLSKHDIINYSKKFSNELMNNSIIKIYKEW